MNNEETRVKSVLDSLVDIINNETHGIDEIANKLREHADRMYGAQSEESTAEIEPNLPNNGLGRLEQALTNLREANSRVAFEAGRNTTFA